MSATPPSPDEAQPEHAQPEHAQPEHAQAEPAEAEPAQDSGTREMASAITEVEELERKARSSRGRNLWVQVSRVGTLGWLVALPIVGGALLGHAIDRRLGTGMTFALALLFVGIVVAGYTLWRHTREVTI